jgi:hypothetical protein
MPRGRGSVKGLGRQVPTPEFNLTTPDGVIIPNGPMMTMKEPPPGFDRHKWDTAQRTGHPITDPSVPRANYPLNYNEYIIYQEDRAKMRFVTHPLAFLLIISTYMYVGQQIFGASRPRKDYSSSLMIQYVDNFRLFILLLT